MTETWLQRRMRLNHETWRARPQAQRDHDRRATGSHPDQCRPCKGSGARRVREPGPASSNPWISVQCDACGGNGRRAA